MTRGRADRAWIAAAWLLAAAGVAVNVWRPTAPPLPTGELPAVARFDPLLLETIATYRAPRLALVPVVTVLGVAVPVAVACSARVRRWIERRTTSSRHATLRAGALASGVAVLTWVVTLPAVAWLGVVHEGRWGFRTADAPSWFRDQLVAGLGRWLLVGVVVAAVLGARARWPRTWPHRLTLAATLAAAAVVLVHPILVQPLFLRTAPLPAGTVRAAVEDVLDAAGLDDVPVLVADASRRTTRVNALFTGLGPTERVVLHDTLLELPTDQVVAVLAHELAHHQHADLARGTLLTAAAALAGGTVLRWLLDGPASRRGRHRSDPRLAVVVVAAAAVLELLGTPIGGLVSRRAEAAADHRALELGADPVAVVRTVRTAVVRDLAAPDPGRIVHLLYGTHPTPRQRLRAAAAAASRAEVPLPDPAQLAAEERELRHPRAPSTVRP